MQPELSRVEPARPTFRHRLFRHSLLFWISLFLVLVIVGGIAAAGAVVTNTLGAGDLFERAEAKIARMLATPPPDRPTVATIEVTPEPETTPSPTPTATLAPAESGRPRSTPKPTPTPIPRVPVDVDIVAHHGPEFETEIKDTWCSPAGVTIALAIMGLVKASDATETKIAGQIGQWDSYSDSHNGDWGPSAMALALGAYGAPGYQVVAYPNRTQAVRGAAKAIALTNSPALLLAWRGAHTWVMTGFRADADPRVFNDAKILGAYIDDPWFPRVSSIWGPSDPPGVFQNQSEMIRNFLPWKRPEGLYPGRDGNFIVVQPTVKRG